VKTADFEFFLTTADNAEMTNEKRPMKNDKWQFVVGTSDFYLSLVICYWPFVI